MYPIFSDLSDTLEVPEMGNVKMMVPSWQQQSGNIDKGIRWPKGRQH